MTLLKRGNSYWIDIGINRARFRKRSPDNSYKGAKAYELLLRQKLARGQPLEEAKPEKKYLFKEVALQWLETYVRNNNKPSEYMNRKSILRSNLIPFFGDKRIDTISTYDVECFKHYLLQDKMLMPKSINNYLCILSRCLKSAVEWNIIKDIPKIKLLKVPPQKFDYLSEIEIDKLLEHATGLWHDMILLALRTGLRFGELIALQWRDINFTEGILTVNRNIVRGIEGSPKNNKSRAVPLTSSVIQTLSNKKHDSVYIFHDENGKPLTYKVCSIRLQKICKMSSLRKITWHVFRHTFASHLAAKKNSIVAIKELLGHSDIRITMRYAHVNLSVLQSAIATLEPSFQFNGTIASQVKEKILI
ncbi:MAG: site-specific integrase [Ignavibacteriae bacterium]|nr:MAG: site-specific integrase [Ignavibacteriota bacterium]